MTNYFIIWFLTREKYSHIIEARTDSMDPPIRTPHALDLCTLYKDKAISSPRVVNYIFILWLWSIFHTLMPTKPRPAHLPATCKALTPQPSFSLLILFYFCWFYLSVGRSKFKNLKIIRILVVHRKRKKNNIFERIMKIIYFLNILGTSKSRRDNGRLSL